MSPKFFRNTTFAFLEASGSATPELRSELKLSPASVAASITVAVPTPSQDGKQVATTFRNLRIAGPGPVGSPLKGTLFAFDATPQEANELKFLETLSVDVVLRLADGAEAQPNPRPVDLQYLVEKYGL